MSDTGDVPAKKRSALRDVSSTTVALTSLAVMSVAAVLSAPVWFYYRRKRKRTDALVSQAPAESKAPEATEPPGADAPAAPESDAADVGTLPRTDA